MNIRTLLVGEWLKSFFAAVWIVGAAAHAADEAQIKGEYLSAEEREIAEAAVAKPVSGELVQIFGWREYVAIKGVEGKMVAKLDTGAMTSSIHAEKQEMFERDGKKWVRFIVTDPTVEGSPRVRIEAPFVRVVNIKEPGGQSLSRYVVKLGLQISDRKLIAEFTLNNRDNMLAPVLLGRSLLKELGMVDPRRTHIADEKIFAR